MQRLAVLVLVAVVATGEALKCYQCEDCDDYSFFSGNSDHKVQECSGLSSCNKFVSPDGSVTKRCGLKETCDGAKGLDSALEGLNNVFGSNLDTKGTLAQPFCCSGDLCNSAPTSLLASAALLMPLLGYVLA